VGDPSSLGECSDNIGRMTGRKCIC